MNLLLDYDNFFLPAQDLESAKEFYGNQLGLETKFDFSDKGMIAFKIGKNEPAIILSTVQHNKPTIWFTVDDVKTTCEYLKEKGVVFLSEPFEIMTGLAVEFNDPFGNKLGITDYSKSIKV
ncbi:MULTISPECIES: VOC family protein [Sphingobacterium]|jgi:predicted enzyme related to lactoylglutathione lyase|uniref:VOC family protein n=1 Tax=Sphingobacterium paramultivorum TaxID=2886510 RepID=A0A7G5DWR6_9SPHI|nr:MULTISPECIES: VOC family protein [Sphingobacterium]QMV66191.1 VOC family protein [Sphingobacterium paramultivorum]WSO14966.1 VOC family protein [Sphingobacterium paramultivorum]